jgi:hypothetical protein
MTHKLLLASFALGLLTSAHAQSNPVDDFFQANYNVTNLAQYAQRRVGQVSYILVSSNQYKEVYQRYLDGGYVKLGESGWQSTSGLPCRDLAIAYARFIGADAVVYTMFMNGKFDRYGNEWCDHTVDFFASASSGSGTAAAAPRVEFTAQVDSSVVLSNSQATTAFNWLQDTLDKPHVASVSYDAKSDSYTWIGPKTGKHMSMSRAQFLAEIWSGYLKLGPGAH